MLNLVEIKRLVVKVGSSLFYPDFSKKYIKSIILDIAEIMKTQKKEVILVSSGAILAGKLNLNLNQERLYTISVKQAAAAVGQTILMEMYKYLLSKHDIKVAQVLVTHSDFINRKSYINLLNTLTTLLSYNILPIINENDSVAVEEIKFGDNDRLAANIATLINARLLVILTDVDGLYDKDNKLIPLVDKINPDIYKLITSKKASLSSVGGMKTKIDAAKIAQEGGVYTVIANGKKDNILKDLIINGKIRGTLFLAGDIKLSAKKRWLSCSLPAVASIFIDDGAKDAVLVKKKSLLPSGILEIKGDFNVGDPVFVKDKDNNILAKGLVNYSKEELVKIKGKKTTEIQKILGYKSQDEVIHRDNMIVYRS